MAFDDAVSRIESYVNTRYDAEVVAAFTAACREGQIRPGVVKLKNDLDAENGIITSVPDRVFVG